LESITVTLKKKQECLAVLYDEILEKCNMEEITKEIEIATETSAKIEETFLKIEETLLKIEAFRNGIYTSKRIIVMDNSDTGLSPEIQQRIETSTPPRMEALQVISPTNSQSRSASSTIASVGVKLPKIALP